MFKEGGLVPSLGAELCAEVCRLQTIAALVLPAAHHSSNLHDLVKQGSGSVAWDDAEDCAQRHELERKLLNPTIAFARFAEPAHGYNNSEMKLRCRRKSASASLRACLGFRPEGAVWPHASPSSPGLPPHDLGCRRGGELPMPDCCLRHRRPTATQATTMRQAQEAATQTPEMRNVPN